MSELMLPTWIIPEEESHEWLDEGSSVFRSAFAPGLAQRQSYGGYRLKLSRRHTVRGEEKAQLLSILKATRGSYLAMRTKVHFALRGAFSTTELLSNNTFASGTTGWTTDSGYSSSSNDRVIRLQRTTVGAAVHALYRSVSGLTANAPYHFIYMAQPGRGPYTQLSADFKGAKSGTQMDVGQMISQTYVPSVTTLVPSVADYSLSTQVYGDHFFVPYTSMSRCALIDNGLNSLLRSDEFDNAAWAKSDCTVTPSAFASPDGIVSSDALVEANTTAQHFVSQAFTVSSAAEDYFFCVAIRAGNRTFCELQLEEQTGFGAIAQYFNLTTKAVGSNGATGSNWSNRQAFAIDIGNGWCLCCLGGRKTNAATSIIAYVLAASADGTDSYLGTSASNAIYMWRGTAAQSSVPMRLTRTVSAASTGTSQNGATLYLKGLPASSSGLLLPGDWFEVNGELKQAASALSSDAAGMGYIKFEPAMLRAPSNDDPFIVADPMGKFLVSNIKIDNEFGTQARVSYDLEHIYE